MKCLLEECCLGGQRSIFEARHYCHHFPSLVTPLLNVGGKEIYGKLLGSFRPLCNRAVLPSRKMVLKSQNPSLSHVFWSRKNLEFHWVFPGRTATWGSSLGTVLGLGQLWLSHFHSLSTLELRAHCFSALSCDLGHNGINWEPSPCLAQSMPGTVLSWHEESLLNYLRSDDVFSALDRWSLSPYQSVSENHALLVCLGKECLRLKKT